MKPSLISFLLVLFALPCSGAEFKLTTKEPGAGLGLGLAISAGIIRKFGGSLNAANRPQGGAEFTIELASVTEMHDA